MDDKTKRQLLLPFRERLTIPKDEFGKEDRALLDTLQEQYYLNGVTIGGQQYYIIAGKAMRFLQNNQ